METRRSQYMWFALNALPFPPVLATWSNGTALPPRLQHCDDEAFPIFLKCCHLTQGNRKSVRKVASCTELRSEGADLRTSPYGFEKTDHWLERMWGTRPLDNDRPWRAYGDEITYSLTRRGFMAQRLLAGVDRSHTMAEFKIEVLWGRAYIGNAGESPCCWSGCDRFFLLRGMTDTDAVTTNSMNCPWVIREGHGACVWRLAEKVARLAAVDSMRVDVFAVQGRPNECQLNELSLSSAMSYGDHSSYMALLWAEPHARRLFHTYGNASVQPIYRQVASDLPHAI